MIRSNVAAGLFAALIIAAGCLAGTGTASADGPGAGPATTRPSKGTTTSAWSVYVWDSRFSTLHQSAATTPAGAVAGFPLQSNMTALLTSTSASGLIGDLTGKTLTASVSLSFTGSIIYGLEDPNSCGGSPATMRFFISSDPHTYSPTKAGRNETGYWWSNPSSVPMDADVSGASITVPLSPDRWSDANGNYGNNPAYTAGFNAAVSRLQQVGVSFGGGCFFDTGIGISGGSGSFTLNTIAAN
jgi:hypothetical protein